MKRIRLGRKGKIVLNLVLTLVLGIGIWLNCGAPYPTAKLELQRMERMNLIPSGEIVYWEEAPNRQSAQMVSVGEEFVVSAAFGRSGRSRGESISVQPREEGPMLVWLRETLEGETASGEVALGRAAVAVQIPEEAVRAELDLNWYREPFGEIEGLLGERQENGMFLFWFDPTREDLNGEPMGTGWSLSSGTYVLRLYWEDGSLLGEYDGYLDQGLHSGGIYLRN